MMQFFYLLISIICEILGTSFLKKTEEFSKLYPSIFVLIMYISALYFLTLTLRTMHVGIVYATCSGVGIILIALMGAILYKESLDLPGIVGLTLIVTGVIIVNLFSKANFH